MLINTLTITYAKLLLYTFRGFLTIYGGKCKKKYVKEYWHPKRNLYVMTAEAFVKLYISSLLSSDHIINYVQMLQRIKMQEIVHILHYSLFKLYVREIENFRLL